MASQGPSSGKGGVLGLRERFGEFFLKKNPLKTVPPEWTL
jgi:hypothetical protein